MSEKKLSLADTTPQQIDEAAMQADRAFTAFRKIDSTQKANFLRSIAERIDTHRDALSATASRETSLSHDRLAPEIDRTIHQCRLFATFLEEGSWVRAIIDSAMPERKPLPRPDLRQMQQALGPVAVFGASNFPFAYSVCGGDTVAALAAGCPVMYKANPGHPATSMQVADIVLQAAQENDMPDGIFYMVTGSGNETGTHLVMHPQIKAVGFTGSLGGGRALFDAAAKRAEPIPVYAEMGSTNPVFILPEMLEQKGIDIARALALSSTASVGQFCTNPGVMIACDAESLQSFRETYAAIIRDTPPAAMLTHGIFESFQKSMDSTTKKEGVSLLAVSDERKENAAGAHVYTVTATTFLQDPALREEMFGPSALQVTVKDTRELMDVAGQLTGQISASVWGTPQDLQQYAGLLQLLEQKAGRIIINGVPTGVEVTAAMNHGGPYPATTDSKFTSVGTQSIYRFTRPVCYQNFPDNVLPEELRNGNPRNIWRQVDNEMTRAAIATTTSS